MNTGRAVILNPSRSDSVKRREFILDSLRKSGLEWSEDIEDSRITITWQGVPKRGRPSATPRKVTLPPPVTLDKALRSRFNCEPDDIEYWDEMIRSTAERESLPVTKIQVRTKWETEQWAEAWSVPVSEHLAVNRADGYWIITHVPTGLAAGSASNLKDALRAAQQVALARTSAGIRPSKQGGEYSPRLSGGLARFLRVVRLARGESVARGARHCRGLHCGVCRAAEGRHDPATIERDR
jgi:hypothetical protein